MGSRLLRGIRNRLRVFQDPQMRMGQVLRFLNNLPCDGRLPGIGDTGNSRGKVLASDYSWATESAYLHLPELRERYGREILAALHGDPLGERAEGTFTLFTRKHWRICFPENAEGRR